MNSTPIGDGREGVTTRLKENLFTRFLMCGLVFAGALILWFRHNAPPGTIGNIFPEDFIYYYYPMLEYASERMADGEMPLWNPYQCGGVPLMATAQVAVFYPGTWLAMLMPVAAAFKVAMFGQVLLGGLFASMFFRSLGVGHYSAGMGGVLFVFACLLGQTLWPPQVCAILWMPFLLLAAERFIVRGSWIWWAAFALGTALQILGGYPQFLVYTFYLLTGYALFRFAHLRLTGAGTTAQSLRRAAALGLACMLALGLTAAQLLPTMELVNDGGGAETLGEDQVHYLEQFGIRSLVLSDILRNAFNPAPKLIAFDHSDGSGYIGIATLFLITVAIVLGRRNPLIWFFLFVAVVSLLLSIGYRGWSAGLYKLYSELPTGGMFRTPSRLRLLSFFSLITLAVFGFEQFRTGFRDLRESRKNRLAVGLVVALLVVLTVVFSTPVGIATAFAAVGLMAASCFLSPNRPAFAGLQGLLVLLMALDLAHATGPAGSLRDIPVKWGQTVHWVAVQLLTADSLAEIKNKAGYDRICLYTLRPEKAVRPLVRAYCLSDYEHFSPGRWVQAHETMGGAYGRLMLNIDPKRYETFYDVASVKYAVVPRVDKEHRAAINALDWRLNTLAPKPTPSGVRPSVVTNEDALPRCYLVGRYEVCSSQEALDRVVRGGFDCQSTVLLEKQPGFPSQSEAAGHEPATITSYTPERVVIHTASSDDRLLVLTDTYYPGWQAAVDGVETEILHANYLFRAVCVPKGIHEVVFEYRPASFRLGIVLSVVSLGVFVLSCAMLQITHRRRSHGSRAAKLVS